MSFNIFSKEFFHLIALSKADINKDGKINDEEYENNNRKINEKSIFDAEYQKFDMDKDGDVDNEDVQLFKNSIGATQEDEENRAKLEEFHEKHPNFNVLEATAEEIEEFEKLCNNSSIEKRIAHYNFTNEVRNTAEYLIKSKNVSLDRYWHSISKILNINNNDPNRNVTKDMDSITLAVGLLLMNFDKSDKSINLANTLSASIINIADSATENLSIQEDALMHLNSLNLLGIDNQELIDDVQSRIDKLKENQQTDNFEE